MPDIKKGSVVTVKATVTDLTTAYAGLIRVILGPQGRMAFVDPLTDVVAVLTIPIVAGDRVQVTNDLPAGPATVRSIDGNFAWVVFDSAPGRGAVRDLDKLERVP
jgi:hypothetical protein